MNESLNDICKYLILSILSVNQYKLEKTYLKLENLEKVGLFKYSHLVEWSQDTIIEKLIQAECDRGKFMNDIFSSRIKELFMTIDSYGQKDCEEILISQDKKRITSFLIAIKGIGEKTISNFFLLTQI